MRVTVHFVDGERLTGDAKQVSLDRGGFTLTGPGGNTKSVWVGSSAVKYIVVHPRRTTRARVASDPREGSDFSKVVLHFLDGEVLHSYEDQVFAEQPGGFVARLWDAEKRELVRALVSGSTLKGVFFVDQWDSRTEDEKRARTPPDEATIAWIDQAVAAAEERSAASPDQVVEPATVVLQGPILVEEPALLDELHVLAEPAAVAPAEPGTSAGTDFRKWAAPAAESRPPDPEPEPAPAPALSGEQVIGEEPSNLVEEPVLVQEPVRVDELVLQADQILAIVVSDPDERRAGFRSSLTPRRLVVSSLPSPEEQRYNQLRARIAEVLGKSGPEEHDDPDADFPDGEDEG